MNWKSLTRNASVAFLAQGVAMMLSVIQTLLVPKLLGTTQFGYWQLFIFYQSYVGFAHLGLNDGVYLIKGGQSRDVIDKRSVNSQFAVGVCFQLAIAVIIVIVALLGGFGPDREFVIACTGIFLVIKNSANYLSFLLQAMNETKRSSYSTIIERLTFLVPLLTLLVIRYDSYHPFVISFIFASFVQLGFCAWCCRDFLCSGLELPRAAVHESWSSIRVGFKLMVANIASQLVLGIARFAVDVVWGIEVFGELSLALSLVSFFLQFVSQAAMVLFPALRQVDHEEVKAFFRNARDAISLFFPIIYALYYPLVWLLALWLPNYANSFIYFVLLIPICVFDSKMSICCTTLFKVLREEGVLLKVNAFTCVASVVFTLVGILAFRSIFAVICGLVIAIVGRNLLSEKYLERELGLSQARSTTVGELLLTVAFILPAILLPAATALCCYCVSYVVYLAVFRRRASELIGKVRKNLNKS